MERQYLSTFVKTKFPHDFTIIGEARDGSEVLELSQKQYADVYLLDIQMPKLNGLETAEQLLKNAEGVTILFITSYAEFSYAQKALQLGVADYLLKPYDDAELSEIMQKILARLDKLSPTRMENTEEETAKQIFFYKSHELLDKVLLNHENWHDPHTLLSYQRDRLDAYKTVVMYPFTKSQDLQQTLMILTGIFSKRNLHVLPTIRSGEIILYLFGDRVRDFQELETSIQRSRSFLLDATGKEVFLGVSSFFVDSHSLTEAYDEAVSFLLQICPPALVNQYKAHIASVQEQYQREKLLVHTLVTKKQTDFDHVLLEHLAQSQSREIYRYLIYLFYTNIFEILGREQDGQILINQAFVELGNQDESTLPDFLIKIAHQASKELGEVGSYHNVHLVRKAIRLIQQQFQDKITLQEIADELLVSYSHLSKCFKQVTGSSFNAFLLQTRMEEAIKLLSSTPLSVAEVGKKVGIDDPYYFSKSFKKFAKMSPSAFISMHALSRENQ